MMAGWQTRTLGDACQIARGGSPRPIQEFMTNDSDGVNWVKISDATASGKFIYVTKEKIKPSGVQRSRLVKPGDFLLSNSMSFGRPYIMQTTGCIHDGWLVLSDYEKCFDQSFLYHLLGSPVVFEQFDRLAAGSTVRNLNIELASRVVLPVPPLPEQQRIVTLLDEALEGIATAKANAETNRQNARAIFEGHLQSVFTQRGDGWVERKLTEISKINYGYTESAHSEPVGPRFLRITDIQKHGVDWDSVPYCPVGDSDLEKFKLKDGDIVFARTGATTGKSFLVSTPPIAVFASYLIRVQLSKKDLLPPFLYLFFQTKSYWDSVKAGSTGSAQGGFNASKLGELVIPYPASNKEQQEIIEKLASFSDQIELLESVYERKLTALDELKKSLLHRAFNGDL